MKAPQRLSAKQALIIRLLCEHGSLYGLTMIELSSGKLKRGTVYVTLGSMEDDGLILSHTEQDPSTVLTISRRVYCATQRGALALKAHDEAQKAGDRG